MDQTIELGYVNEEDPIEPASDLENSQLHEREAKTIFKRKIPSKTFSDAASSRVGSPSIHSGKQSFASKLSNRALSRRPMGFSIEELTQESSEDQNDLKNIPHISTQKTTPDFTLMSDTNQTKIELLAVDRKPTLNQFRKSKTELHLREPIASLNLGRSANNVMFP